MRLRNAASISGQGTWETTLQGRDLDGDLLTFEAYYDSSLNITWLADANYAGAQMTWANASAWAANLNINGYTGWRLPTVTDTDGPDADALGNDGCDYDYTGTDCGYNVDTASGEMAHMFYATRGNKSYFPASISPHPQAGWSLTNTGPFSDVQAHNYWSATEYAPDTARYFYNDYGQQYIY